MQAKAIFQWLLKKVKSDYTATRNLGADKECILTWENTPNSRFDNVIDSNSGNTKGQENVHSNAEETQKNSGVYRLQQQDPSQNSHEQGSTKSNLSGMNTGVTLRAGLSLQNNGLKLQEIFNEMRQIQSTLPEPTGLSPVNNDCNLCFNVSGSVPPYKRI